MSKPSEIFTALKTLLQNSSHLSYVNDSLIFLDGEKEFNIFPCIVITPGTGGENEAAYPKVRITDKVVIELLIDVKNKTKQIVGDSIVKGITDVKNDLCLALDSDVTLGGKCQKMSIVTHNYIKYVDYPIRSVEVIVDILYEQTKGTRT